MPRRDLQLSEFIDNEILDFINSVNSDSSTRPSVLLFDKDLDDLYTKTIRYFAILYNLAAFYIEKEESRCLLVCEKSTLREPYRSHYETLYDYMNEDVEPIYSIELYDSFIKSKTSISLNRKRRQLGLPTNNRDRRRLAIEDNRTSATEEELSGATASCAVNEPSSEENTISNLQNAGNLEAAQIFTLPSDHIENAAVPVMQVNEIIINTASDTASSASFNNSVSADDDDDEEDTASCTASVRSLQLAEKEFFDQQEAAACASSLLNVNAPEFIQHTGTGSTASLTPVGPLETNDEYIQRLSHYTDHSPIIVHAKINDHISKFTGFYDCMRNNVVEVYNIPYYFDTQALIGCFCDGPIRVKWCDDYHALVIFGNREHVRAVRVFDQQFQIRHMTESSAIALITASSLDLPVIINSINLRNRNN